MSRWPSKRLLRRLGRKIKLTDYGPDWANLKCIEGGSWDYPNGIKTEPELERLTPGAGNV